MRLLVVCFTALCIVGCGTDSAADPANSLATLPVTALSAAQLPTFTPPPPTTLTPTAPPTQIGPLPLRVWLPEPLAPLANPTADMERASWVEAFSVESPTTRVTLRIKRPSDVGGILPTIRSASLVAPSALPDLTLMRRSDLLAASLSGLIQPLDSTAFSAIIEDMHPAVADLGLIDGVRFGLAYTVDLQHLVLPEGLVDAPADPVTWRFDEVLLRETMIYLPLGRSAPLNDVFLAQYRAAVPNGDDQALPIEPDALRRVIAFYEQAAAAGIVPRESGAYSGSTDYLPQIMEGGAGVITASTFLALRANPLDGEGLTYAPLPTADGEPTAVIDGWIWVMTTADAGRQSAAAAWLDLVFQVDRHARYAEAVALIPTGRTTLRQYDDADYAAFIDDLLENSTLPLSEAAGGPAARAMQSALLAVVAGDRSAAQAVEDILAAVGG